jgi:hypothetical protein
MTMDGGQILALGLTYSAALLPELRNALRLTDIPLSAHFSPAKSGDWLKEHPFFDFHV